ncbi:MAG: hypothetical protein AB7G23_07480 [Vicinamibacterales bacterium]
MRVLLVCLGVCVAVTSVAEAQDDVAARVRTADRVVVATVSDVASRFAVNQFGDRLIVSDVTLSVDEAMKGAFAPVLSMTVEGGTVGDLTLQVSDMPMVRRGERLVLFLRERGAGRHEPVGRGDGIERIDRAGRLGRAGLSLDELRTRTRDAARRGGAR